MSSSGQGSRSPSASASNASPSSPAEKQAPIATSQNTRGNTEKAETQKAIDKEEADKKKERHGKMVDDLHDRVDLAFKSGLLCIL
ncbi:hypothetical protein PG991_012791 [Apiospora marii]|uniref:Uncharacterized protein n=1 Tax=Apiospora marii TaxID=335849 RepID=A0ABR1RAS0_9PEZI